MTVKRTPRDVLIYPAAGIVFAGWSASLVIGLFTHVYTPLEITSPGMWLVLGYVFGVQVVKRGKEEK